MNTFTKTLLISACLVASGSAFAAKPTSITFVSEGKAADGQDFATYVVKCSDGQEKTLSAWDQRKKWCVGESADGECENKQIRAAKSACK